MKSERAGVAVSPPAAFSAHATLDEVTRGVRGALEASDWSSAVHLVGLHWSLLLDEPGNLLDHALRVIPLNAFEQDARAAAVRDIRLHSSSDAVDRMLGAASLPDADDLVKLEGLARSESALSLLSVASSRMIAFRVRGRMTRARQLALLVERFGRIAAVHQPALVAGRLPAALLHAGITRGLADDLGGAMLPLRDAYERGEEARVAYVARDAAGKSALFLALDGDIEQARFWLTRHDDAPAAHGWYKPRIALTADIARTIVAIEGLRPEEAAVQMRTLEQPVNAEQSWGPTVSYARARYALAWGDRLGAVEVLRADRIRYADWLSEGATMGPLLTQAEVDLLLSLRQIRKAHRAVDAQSEHLLVHVMRARTALVDGNFNAAARGAATALTEPLSTRARVDALVTYAAARQQLNGPGHLNATSDLVAAVRERGALLPVLAAPPETRQRLSEMLPKGHGARDTLPTNGERIRITPQQQAVLHGIDQGLTLREIASQSHVSVNTVKTHVRALYHRLNVATRDEVVARAYDLGLL